MIILLTKHIFIFWTQVHAAIELLDLAALAKLLNEEARFHFGRKLTDSEVNIFAG